MTNRLAQESSPYLQQHAENPVDWYPWGSEAMTLAQAQDKPILLSVGYSACHWCHVMAHESFEDPAIAAKMNKSFINVKVDREERPDVDALYMDAVVGTTGHGGWPMTVVMTPAGEPFFAGTYFPPTSKGGIPGFGELLDAIATKWSSDRISLDERAILNAEALQHRAAAIAPADDMPDRELLAQASQTMIRDHDPVHGGFGEAPKFPQPMAVDVLFRHYASSGDLEALRVAELALDHMAAGGIYDHLGGGFSRYSVDAEWAVPHFEKMLYDNAQLLTAYLHGWQLTGAKRHLQVVRETIEYVLRDLRLEGGGFASAEDADSEGEEGRFYAWTEAQLSEVLGTEEMILVRNWYGVTSEGNFEGATVLHRPTIGELSRPEPVESIRAKLFDLRSQRIRPGLDDKVLTEWNALMIAALAEAGAVVGNQTWIEAAVSAMEFLENHLLEERRWYRSWHKTGGRRHLAYAADYAAMIDAYTRLGEATGHARWHTAALSTAEAMIELFWDDASGGVFTTGNDAERLLVRRKELFDSPVPSANANAAFALHRVASVHGRDDLQDRANDIIQLVGVAMGAQPLAHCRLVSALGLATGPTSEIVVAGTAPELLSEVRRRYLPNSMVIHGEPFESPLWANRSGDQAYVCKNYACALPTADRAVLASQLDSLNAR